MKKTVALGFSALLLACNSNSLQEKQANQRVSEHGPKRSSLEVVQNAAHFQHLSFLASDEMKGRDTGSDELKIAAKYLATHLQTYGFKGIGENGSFFQPMELYRSQMDVHSLEMSYNGTGLDLQYGKDYTVFSWSNEDLVIDAPLTAVSYGYNDDQNKNYNPASVEGKIAVRFDLTKDLLEAHKNNRAMRHQSIREGLYQNKAKAVVFVIDDNERAEKIFNDYIGFDGKGDLSREKEKNPRTYVMIKRRVFDQILKIEKKKRFNSKKEYAFKSNLKISIKSIAEKVLTQNVVAVLEGSDPTLKEEYVGYGSHYDHEGIKDGEIYNGANDDGSGTVAVLSVAKALALDPPKRSSLIIFHTGEEKGLWGSEYFTDNPLIPLDKLVAMVNMDMIGSDHEIHKIYVTGADRISQDLHDINEMMNNASVKLELDYKYNAPMHPERIYYRSDHYNYAKKGIPVVFFGDDDPEHYHKPNDDVEFINFTKLKRVAQLAYATGYTVANQPERIKITTPVKPALVSKEFADNYVGTYHMNAGFPAEIVYIDGALKANVRDELMEMKWVNNHLFNTTGLPFEFDVNDEGIATQLSVKFYGREFVGAKEGFKLQEKSFAISAEALHRYAGEYTDPKGRKIVLEVEGNKLVGGPEGQPPAQFTAISETAFEFKMAGMKIEFQLKNSNEIEGFTLNMNGKNLGLAKRMN